MCAWIGNAARIDRGHEPCDSAMPLPSRFWWLRHRQDLTIARATFGLRTTLVGCNAAIPARLALLAHLTALSRSKGSIIASPMTPSPRTLPLRDISIQLPLGDGDRRYGVRRANAPIDFYAVSLTSDLSGRNSACRVTLVVAHPTENKGSFMSADNQQEIAEKVLELKQGKGDDPEYLEHQTKTSGEGQISARNTHEPVMGAFDSEGHRPVLERSRKVR